MNPASSNGYADTKTVDELTLPEIAELRHSTYRLFAASLHHPEEKRLETLAVLGMALRSEEERFAILFPFYPEWARMLDRLAHLTRDETHASARAYRHLFYAHVDEPRCPPYESYYRRRAGEDDTGRLTGQLLQRYRQAGLALAPEIEQVPDHAVVQLEFMAYLCGYEAQAWRGDVSESGYRALKRESAFLRRHLGRWFPSLARRVISQEPDGLYAAITRTAEAFIHHDQDLIALLLEYADHAQQETMELRPNEP